MIRRPPRSTLFPSRRSSDLHRVRVGQVRVHGDRGPLLAAVGAREHEHAFRRRLGVRSEEHTSELQSRLHLVCRLLLEKKKKNKNYMSTAETADYCSSR